MRHDLFSRDGTYYGGYTYSSYGEARNTAPSSHVATNNKLRYIAGYWDDTADAYRLGARYYDPGTGRFTQYDPSGQEANPYNYAGCNPINLNRPDFRSVLQARMELDEQEVFAGDA